MGCLKGPHKITELKCGVSVHLNIKTVASVVYSLVVAINIKLKVGLSRQKSQAYIF